MCQHFSFVCLIHSAAGVTAVLGQRRRRWDNIVPTLAGRFRVLLGRLWACAGALLGHRRRRWSSFWADFGSGFLLADACIAREDAGIGPMLFCCWAGVLNGGPAVKPLWVVV